jgi:hypothetical protein
MLINRSQNKNVLRFRLQTTKRQEEIHDQTVSEHNDSSGGANQRHQTSEEAPYWPPRSRSTK